MECGERLAFGGLAGRPVGLGATEPPHSFERVGRDLGDLTGDLLRVGDPGDESHPAGFRGVDHAPRQREIARDRRRQLAADASRPAPRAEQPESDAVLGERRASCGDPEVTRQREFHAATARWPVHARDDDRVRVGESPRDALAVGGELGGVRHRRQSVQIGTGTERRATPFEQHHRFVRVTHRVVQRGQLRGTESVARLWPVEHDPTNTTRNGRRTDHVPRWPAVSKGLCVCPRYGGAMDDAVRVREAARDAVADVDPDRLRDVLHERLADAVVTPGVLTLVAARAPTASVASDPAVADRSDPAVGDHAPDAPAIADRAAGVQLIYEGLRLTRRLAHDDAWNDAGEAVVSADLSVLAADVFVARGFYLLARTEAAGAAVEVVRRFGRDQTNRETATPAAAVELDRELEADVFELAVVTGTTAAGADPSAELKSYAAELADTGDGLPPVSALPDSTPDRIAALADRVAVDS